MSSQYTPAELDVLSGIREAARNARKETAMNTEFSKSTRCPVCRATIIVRKNQSVPYSLMRSLAVADHVRILHMPNVNTDSLRR